MSERVNETETGSGSLADTVQQQQHAGAVEVEASLAKASPHTHTHKRTNSAASIETRARKVHHRLLSIQTATVYDLEMSQPCCTLQPGTMRVS